MTGYQEGTVTANGIKHHFYRSTPEHPRFSIVMLHGVTDNGMCWVRVADALKDEYDVIMMDARGHGLSDAPDSGYASEDRAADVAALIERLELDRPALFGHSMGADTAITTAALFPGRMRGVILEDPPWRDDITAQVTAEERRQRINAWAEEIRRNNAATKEELITRARAENPQWPEEELEPWAVSKQQVSPNIATMRISDRRPWYEYAAEAECPILLITAEPERGSIVTPETAAQAGHTWRQGKVAHIPGAGHCIHRDQFNPAMEAVREFLKSL